MAEQHLMLIHLDTDFGGDPDDACALAFLLASPSAELTAITTNLDRGGYRAGCVRYYLDLADQARIPVASGAAVTLTDQKQYDSTAADARYWPSDIRGTQNAPGAALDLLLESIEKGATIVATGAATNLALLEVNRPGILMSTRIVFMGGWIRPAVAGLPQWGPEADWNVQCDPLAASIVANHGNLTLVTLPATLSAWLRETHLERLRATGPVGALLARQSELYAQTREWSVVAARAPSLPADLINILYDPVAAAVALGWPGVRYEKLPLRNSVRNGVLRFEQAAGGRLTPVVVHVDGEAFTEYWLNTIEGAKWPAT